VNHAAASDNWMGRRRASVYEILIRLVVKLFLIKFCISSQLSTSLKMLCYSVVRSLQNTLSSTVCKAKAIVNVLLRYHEINYLHDVDGYICLAAEKLCKSYVAPSLDPDAVKPDLDLD
jgi:hypothetical protein